MGTPEWLVPVLFLASLFVVVFLTVVVNGPPASGWCNRNRRHEWSHWECISVGRVSGCTVNKRVCKY
jgi:hypothetical protein